MGYYSRFLAATMPDYAMRRLRAMRINAAYESTKPSRTHKVKRESRGANDSSSEAATSLREQARYLEENNDIAKGALDILVNRTVGMGIIPEFMVEKENGDLYDEVNEQLSELYEDWCRKSEVTWRDDETSAQRLAARTFFRDGEVFNQHLLGFTRGLTHGSVVPYSYELIEPDMVPMHYHNQSQRILSGVQMNGWGRPIRYHVLKNAPEQSIRTSHIIPGADETRPIPANRMSHISIRRRIRQVRGVSVFAVVLKRLSDIDEIDETERVAARIAAAMALVITKGDPALYTAPQDDEGTNRDIPIEPGMIIDDLLPGEDVKSFASNRPNNQLIPFKESQFKSAAGGLGVGASSLGKNYNGNYSSQRQELVEQHDHYGVVWKYIVERFEREKVENFIRATTMMPNGVRLPDDAKAGSLYRVHFSRPAMPWIQPLQEAKAWETLVANEFESVSGIIRSRGGSPRQVKKQREREQRTQQESPSNEKNEDR
jgi:lambda family phage portal protein